MLKGLASLVIKLFSEEPRNIKFEERSVYANAHMNNVLGIMIQCKKAAEALIISVGAFDVFESLPNLFDLSKKVLKV